MSDEYDAAVAASMQPNAAQSARVGFAVAADTNADAYAEAQRVARRTGVPVDTAMALPDEMRRQDRMGSIDFDALAKTSPATAALLGNVERAKVAHDDVDNLSGFESMLYSVGKFEVGTGKAIASAVPKFNEGMWGVARAGAETFVPEVLGRKVLADKFAQWGGMQREMASGLMPKADGLIESSWYSGMQSLGLNALLLPISLASGGSMAPMLAGMGLSTGGAAYGEARDKGVSVPQALAFGTSQGVIEAGTEMIGMPALFSLLKPGQFARKAAEYMVKDQGGEQVATHLQDLNEWAVLNPDKTLGDYLSERPGAAVQTALATAFGGGGQVALMKGVEIIATRNDIRVGNADKTLDLLGRINEMATASKVLARDADTFEAHVNAIAETGQAPAAVFVSAQTLQQAGIAEQLAQVSPAVAEQMESALQMGGDIRIPIAEYATKIAPTEYAQSMVDHIKFDAEGFSKAEAQTYMQEKAPELQAEVDRVLGEQSADETWKASAQEVEDAVFGELQTAGRFTEHVNRTDAVLHKAFASVMAAKLGVTPMAFFKAHTLRVIAERMDGAQFDQAGNRATDTPSFKNWFGESKVVDAQGQPLRVFHGTAGDFDTFDPSRIGSNFGVDKAGFFFTDSPIAASGYADSESAFAAAGMGTTRPATEGANVMPVLLSIKNPLTIESYTDSFYTNPSVEIDEAGISLTDYFDDNRDSIIQFAKEGNHDGVLFSHKGKTLAVAFSPTQIKSATGNRGTFDPNDANILHQSAFHGSPFHFDTFSLEHMGKGEGAQAFGWGLYFAGDKAIAEFYRQSLASKVVLLDGKKLGTANLQSQAQRIKMAKKLGYADSPEAPRVVDDVQSILRMLDYYKGDWAKVRESSSELADVYRARDFAIIDALRDRVKIEAKGQLYEVDIPEDDAMLLWDKPLSEQSDGVRAAIETIAPGFQGATERLQEIGKQTTAMMWDGRIDTPEWNSLVDEARALRKEVGFDPNVSGEDFYKQLSESEGYDEAASKYLNTLGIHGIKYLDGSSRTKGDGSYNYVIFDDSAIKVLQTYYQNTQGTRGSFNPETNTIALLKNADLSTFLHESGHFFLEVQASVANQLAQDAAIHGADTLKPGEKQILADHNALLAWFGVKDMAEWNNLDFEEKRAYHEQFARGFEAYLYEGKAPSIELHGVFQRFRAWLLNVYKSLTALNVELTPEVRGVFDRMLATTEQIQLAEQARSMMPLFERADQAGMTPEDFADYQAQGVDATNTASEELQARGLRDMQWLHNARGRMIKKLQKESEARRAEVRMDARREIMSQPVYRAWSFLTRKVERDDMLDGEKARADHQTAMKAWEDKRTAFDTEIRKDAKQTVWAASEEGQKKYQKGGTLAKAQAKVLRREEKAIDAIAEKALAEWDKTNRKPADPDARQKSDPNSIDESQDTLFTAIAKFGGINKADLISTWGVDPADKASSGVFGKHVMRATDQGMSIDGMAEQLSQYGYLQLDENGKWDLAEFEEKFKAELGGDAQHSISFDYGAQQQQDSAGRDLPNPDALQAGRLNRDSLDSMGLPPEVVKLLDAQRMAKRDGLHPDIVAEIFGFSSGDEMVRALAAADKPGDAIEGLTDQRMLEQYGDLSSQQEIEKAADQAIHNDVRARMVATEANALAKATGKPKILAEAAKAFAGAMIARLKVRNITPGQYASAEARAAKAAAKAGKVGDLATAGAEKRNQLINSYATRAAYDAQTEVEKIVRYFKAIDKSKTLPADYLAQIQMLLDKYDLRAQSGAAIDRKASLRTWVQSRLNLGEIPAISEALLSPTERKQYEAQINARDEEGNLVYPDDDERIKLLADAIEASAKRPYKELTVEELRGLNDTIKQIEHLGKLKDKLLTKMEGAGYAATRDLLVVTVEANAKEQGKNTRTDNTWLGGKIDALKQFGASHIKPAIWMRIFDGGQDNGPWWSTIVRPANERATFETSRRAAATSALMEILGPVLKNVSHLDQIGKGRFFPSIGASLNWQERMAFAFNYGNESNLQRLMGGGIAGVTKALTMGQVQSVLNTLSAAEWHAVQAVWNHFETYRSEIAAKELRVNGTEPKWIDARQFMIKTSDGETLTLRGGYFPVKFDAKTSLKAQQHSDAQASKDAMKAAYSAATTQRSFTKERVEEVTGRPLLLNLSGLYSGVNDVIHDLAWHEWVIDVNRLLRSESIDAAIREHYGANVKKELTKWRDDIVAGSARLDHGIENAAGWARKFVSSAALTYNVISALMQPLGITQSFSRVGAKWVGMGLGQYASGPIEATKMVQAKSEYMTNRTRTMFRDINELRNRVAGQTTGRELMGRYGYYLTMHFQMMVDVPTWIGAYEKALAQGHADDVAIALADQSVKDSQGGGEEVDQSGITRGGPMVKLFTAFYDFMNTQANVLYLKNATATNRADAWMNMALVGLVTPLLAAALRDALIPGDSGEWEDWDKVWKKLLTEGMGNLIGMVAFGREFSQAAKALWGDDKGMGYTGPAGIRVIPDIGKLGKQINQRDLDDAFRKSFVTVMGDLGGIPAVQINRSITGANALSSGETDNPAALVFGFQKKR